MVAEYVLLGLILLGLAVLMYGGYYNWITDLEYQRVIGQYFQYADRASDAKTKLEYFNQYITALEKYGLNDGYNSVFFKEQPNSNLKEHFKIAKSLQIRLNETSTLDPATFEYASNMNQITLQEFCWFPEGAFQNGYLITHNAWGSALTPPDPYDRCHTQSSK